MPDGEVVGDATGSEVENEKNNKGKERLIGNLLSKCRVLLQEIEEFRAYLAAQKKESKVELRQFRNSVLSELRSLEKLSLVDQEAERTTHTLRSSNLPFYNAVWASAKRSTELVAFSKRFYYPLTPAQTKDKFSKKAFDPKRPPQACALVDVVSSNGLQWTKVSCITATRIGFDLANLGYDSASSEGFDDEEDGEGDLPLVKMARGLIRAASATTVRYMHPEVHLVLPNLSPSAHTSIGPLLDTLRMLGIQVHLPPLPDPAPLSAVLPALAPATSHPFTETVNVDCTLLLALLSDLSHETSIPTSQLHPFIRRQIAREEEHQMLPRMLYPVLEGRRLTCTDAAAQRMREIVDMIGTEGEKARMDILMGWRKSEGVEGKKLRKEFQSLSRWPVPEALEMPVKVIKVDVAALLREGKLPLCAKLVDERLAGVNKSVFLYGWAEGITTLTSNRGVEKVIRGLLQKEEEVRGPDVWVCEVARSLVGKEKGEVWAANGNGSRSEDETSDAHEELRTPE